MSAPDAMRCFETLVTRMEGAVAIDAWLLGLGDEGALLAERLTAQLPGQRHHAKLDLNALAQGALQTTPELALSAIFSEKAPVVLVDAVLWRGETVVQAVSLLRENGVHAPIELAVLADRGGYLVPIAPTYCGGEIVAAEDTVLQLAEDGKALRFCA
ncbi:MAG: hypothetical protein LBE32_05005 [Burkholderiales bacterium]|jgi:pyrimidine operon attenuation protein/uracil phosphoribosyltransferase|nr:hypothetical protein [Burkholderiales bacterium]